ncbi:MAG: potassium channel family protein, partial [Rhodospirillales bacterium]|nr:potassium channel family protein [Rhodospirillales bacterium]
MSDRPLTLRHLGHGREGFLASPARNLIFGLLFIAVVMTAATTAYVAAGWPLPDALYMVLITVYTVGFEEVRPVDTPLLRGITMATIVLGCTGVIFLTGALVQFITLNQLTAVLGLKRMTTQIEKLGGHVIICGFGRIGLMLAKDLDAGGTDFVIVDQGDARLEQARGMGYLCVQGDATDEAALREAGVERARVLATVLPNDAANVFITLSARSLNPGLEIIARGEAPSTESKLLQAGANRVVLPTHIGAERIAEMILYQPTARFIRGSERMREFEKTLRRMGLDMDVATAATGSAAVGRTVGELEAEAQGAFFVVQVNRREGEAITSPD